MQKAAIRSIGLCWPHPPDAQGHTWTARDWAVEGGDFPGIEGWNLGGWTLAELALISDLAKSIGHDEALARANRYREMP